MSYMRTKRLLDQYRDMEWKAANAQRIIRECNDMMTSIRGWSTSAPVQGSENHREELMANCIDRKAGAEEAVHYMSMMDEAISHLPEEESTIIMEYFVDHNGIVAVMRTCHVGRTRAYEKARETLVHLDKLLFR